VQSRKKHREIFEIFHEIFHEIFQGKTFHEILHHYLCKTSNAANDNHVPPVALLSHSSRLGDKIV